jgi:uncharacterized membrane protein
VRSLWHNESASVLVVFALMLVPLLLISGLAIDYLRLQRIHQELQVAVDAAATAGAKVLLDEKATEEDFKKAVQGYFVENWWDTHKSVKLGTFSVGLDKEMKIVQIGVEATVPMVIMKLIGMQDRRIEAMTTVTYKTKDDLK